MRICSIALLLVLLSAAAFTQQDKEEKPGVIPGFDINALDRSIDPCTDFYLFACGTWNKNNPIPADQSRWGRFNELQERNKEVLRGILEKVSKPDPKRSPIEKKIGDYYASCMDEKTVESLGAKPIQPELDRIAKMKSRQDLIDTVAALHKNGIRTLFAFYPNPDFRDAMMMIANVDQGGLGLPDRDYYFKEDPKSVETREKYVEHVQKMFELAGDATDKAAAEAKTVMSIETGLAKPAQDRVTRRDPHNRDHRMTRDELLKIAPSFQFTRYFDAMASPSFSELNVTNPEFFKNVNAQLDSVPLADWQTYLRWHVLRANAPVLSSAFVNESFRFYNQYLNGQKEIEPRWKRCVEDTDDELGEALGQPYVEETFGADGKQRTLAMVKAIEGAMGQDLQQLTWMSDATKQQAEIKLHKVANNIGYPDKWRDYGTVDIKRDDFVGDTRRADAFEVRRQINKIGKPVDRKEWGMTPPTVNAYYRGSMNDINFPAGILQPPFFDKKIDDPINYGAIGAVVGHELTHGFDDQGRKYDADGNLRDWWTAEDGKKFEERAQCIVDEYGSFTAVDDVKVNGKLTLGENTADNGGVRLSYMALQSDLKNKPQGPIDGFTPEQRFFLGYAQIWCQNVTPENARVRAFTDPHSPGRYRVNGVVSNMPEFREAYHCKPGSAMIRENSCRVW